MPAFCLISVLCFLQNTQDVQTTLNILCILNELLTVGKYTFSKWSANNYQCKS